MSGLVTLRIGRAENNSYESDDCAVIPNSYRSVGKMTQGTALQQWATCYNRRASTPLAFLTNPSPWRGHNG